MKEQFVTVVQVNPRERPVKASIKNDLASMQKAVGGLIEVFRWKDFLVVCNDEGKVSNMLANRALFDENGKLLDVICGPFFLVQSNVEGDFISLSNDEVEKGIKEFFRIDFFYNNDGQIGVLQI